MLTRSLALAAVLISATASAQDATVHRHFGFYLRLDAGLGGFNSKLDSQDLTVHGGAGSFGVAVGGALTENLILAGHLFGMSAVNPEVSSGGVSVTSQDTNVGVGVIGPQLTYYFMPVNLFLSGTIGVSRIYSTIRGVDYTSDAGFGFQFGIGKEWWVGDHWGIGLAGQLTLASNKDSESSGAPTWNTGAIGLVFSATYN